MLLFCSTMHFASGRVRRKTSQFVAGDRCVFREFLSKRTGCSQNCVSPKENISVITGNELPYYEQAYL